MRRAIQSVANRTRAEQPKRLGHTFTLRLDVVESPEHERHRLRVTAVLLFVTIEQTVCDRFTARGCNRGRHAVRIDCVSVSAGRENVRILNDVGAWTSLDKLTAQCAHE